MDVTDKAVTRISFYPDNMDSTYKMKQKMKKLFWATLLSQIVLLSACQQTTDDTNIPQIARLNFTSGSSISDGTYEDYNPVMVQLANGKLVLVFVSDRPCSVFCSAHNIFFTASSSTYSNDRKVPNFQALATIISNTNAISLTGPIRIAVAVNGNQINIYFKDGPGSLTISETGFFDPTTGANTSVPFGLPWDIGATGTGCKNGGILGLDTSNNLISVASTNAISRYNPASYAGNCNTINMFSNTSLSSALRLSPMRSATIGIPEGFLVTESAGKLSAQTASIKGPQIKSFTDGLTAQGLTLTSASVLVANQAAGDLLVFSASAGSGKPSDLYVLANKTPGELWLKYVGYGNQPTP